MHRPPATTNCRTLSRTGRAVYKASAMVDERIGAEVAGYRIESVLGQGGMGTVYVAEQSAPRRKVALKLLRHELSSDEDFRRRFEHESETAASTEHPNIVPIYSAGEADGTLYIAMRYVEGTDLRDLIATEGPLPPDRAVAIVSQVAGALDAAHRRGLVHRDVKPGNVLLDGSENAYLSDFGLIKRSEVDTALTKTGQFMGSIEYCAPEQIRGDAVDGRADVYSLGCVLYECLTGRSPFKRETEIATLYAHLEEAPPPLGVEGDEPRELEPVIARAMAKRPGERYATAGEFARAARHALGQTSGERETTTPRAPRRRTVLVAGAVVVAAAVGVLAFALSSGDGDAPPPAGPLATGSVVNTVQNIDPETGEVLQAIGDIVYKPENLRVGGLAAGEGGVWVANFANVQHVDPLSATTRATVPIDAPFLSPVVAFRTVWVATGDSVERINPATDELLRPIRLSAIGGIALPAIVAAGEGAVWAALDKTLYRIDPVANEIAAEIALAGSNGVAVGEGAVWVIDKLSGSLTAIDPGTGEVSASTTLAGNLDDVVAGGGSVWVLDRAVGIVAVVDPESLAATNTVRVGDDEQNIVFGAGAVWLADGEANSISRIDPLTREVATFPMGGPVADVTVDPDSGAVWVLLADKNG